MTALLASVEAHGEAFAERLSAPGIRRAVLVGPAGAGKATALRHAHGLLAADSQAVLLDGSDDDVAPVNLLNGLAASLEASGHRLPPTDDADRPPWDNLLARCAVALERTADERFVVLVSGVDHLERLSDGGGAPGRHAGDVLDLLHRHAPRLGITTAAPRNGRTEVVALEAEDLTTWLEDEELWGPLAPAATVVANAGSAWRRLPALSVRLAIALAYVDALPPAPPATPLLAGRLLAEALASRRTGRPVWASWQLIASLRGPLTEATLDVLLTDLPEESRGHPLLRQCLLFSHDGWHLHPILRQIARFPPAIAATRALPDDLVRNVGRRMVEHFRGEAARLAGSGDVRAAAVAHAAALDACAMAQDETLADGLSDQLPDPYDHVGRRSAHDIARSYAAFERARTIDETDATALRGLADAEDRQAVDATRVARMFRRVIELEPQDVASHVRLTAVLLAAARPRAAMAAFDESASVLAGVLGEADLAERLLVPVARTAVAAGHLALASRASAAARGAVASADARELDRLVEALIETLEYGEFAASQRLGTQWWRTPQMLADFDASGHRLSRWLAARIDEVEGDRVTIHYAHVALPPDPSRRPDRHWTTMARDELNRLSLDELPDPLVGAILEIGIYGDGVEAGSTVIRVADSDGVTLPDAGLPLDRYTTS